MSLSVWVTRLAKGLAIAGGLVLIVITLVTVVSITGRAFLWAGLRPIPGDFEIVEVGVGFAVFAFLPWCQLRRAHATVDVFTTFFPDRVNRVIDFLAELLMTVVIIVIAWRLWYGLFDKIRFRETTFILQFPVWWGFALAMVAAAIAVVVSLYMLYVRAREMVSDAPAAPASGGHL
jgi:TRAP-type C4-dicarboxylate transport system permease small subunit